MAGRKSGIEKRIVLLRMPMPLYDAVMQTSKGLNIQSIILHTLRMKYGKARNHATNRQNDSEKTGKETRTRRAERLDSA